MYNFLATESTRGTKSKVDSMSFTRLFWSSCRCTAPGYLLFSCVVPFLVFVSFFSRPVHQLISTFGIDLSKQPPMYLSVPDYDSRSIQIAAPGYMLLLI